MHTALGDVGTVAGLLFLRDSIVSILLLRAKEDSPAHQGP